MSGRLATLLRIRRIEERRRAGDVGRAEADLAEVQAEADRRREERFAWAIPSGVPLDAAGLRLAQTEALALHDGELTALAEVAASRARRDRAEQSWSEARVGLKSVERLAEHRAARDAAAAAARAQAAADEMALLMRRRSS